MNSQLKEKLERKKAENLARTIGGITFDEALQIVLNENASLESLLKEFPNEIFNSVSFEDIS